MGLWPSIPTGIEALRRVFRVSKRADLSRRCIVQHVQQDLDLDPQPSGCAHPRVRGSWVGLDLHEGRQAQTAQEERWYLNGLGRKLDLWSR